MGVREGSPWNSQSVSSLIYYWCERCYHAGAIDALMRVLVHDHATSVVRTFHDVLHLEAQAH